MTTYYNRTTDFTTGTKFRSTDLNAEFDAVETAMALVAADVDSAALSVTTAGSNTTSTTSNTIGTGSKTWTVETGKSLVVGMFYRMASTASPTTFAAGTVTAYNSSTGSLTLNVTVTSGSGTITAWTGSLTAAIVGGTMTRRAITGADTVIAGDNGGLLDITSGTFTLSYTAAATLGSGFWCVIRNSGTGDVTHDPASSETIDGLTSFVMYPGESRLVQCNGTAFYSIVLSGFNKTFTASGTFTRPPGYSAFSGLLWAGGSSGGKGDGLNQAGGGAGGACLPFTIPFASVGSSETVTIGAGGTAVTGALTAGNAGGNSSFGSSIVSYGGGAPQTSSVGGGGGGLKAAGIATAAGAPADGGFNGGGAGGNSAAGNSSYWGGGGGGGGPTDAAYAGGASVWGGGGGGNGPVTTAGAGGASTFGGAGGAGGTSGNGTAGTAPGGGGGATKTGTSSGAGARGELRIWGVV